MHSIDKRNINDFRVVGINYKKTDASLRGRYAINNQQYETVLNIGGNIGLHSFFILSTCNRTEIYGFAGHEEQLMQLVCSQCEDGDITEFKEMAYAKKGWEAIKHLFEVSAGLDSQILGDYEILGQIKTAARFAKEHGRLCPFVERVVNSVIQSSKAVKTHTALSSGSVSVAFAAVQYIKEHVFDIAEKNILLAGTGKIGRNTCQNLVDYLKAKNIVLTNRTYEKAAALAAALDIRVAPYEQLEAEIKNADIILVATNAPEPTILKSYLENTGSKLVIDLSIPSNVACDAQTLPNITFINVDELSKIKDETLQKRTAEVPKALAIISEHIADLQEWYEMRKHVPMLKEVKTKLQELHESAYLGNNAGSVIYAADPEEKIQKVINTLAAKMRRNNIAGCHYIEAINEFIA